MRLCASHRVLLAAPAMFHGGCSDLLLQVPCNEIAYVITALGIDRGYPEFRV